MKKSVIRLYKCLSVAVIFGIFTLTGCQSAPQDEFLSEIGVCTGWNNGDTLSSLGYTFIEAGVKWGLIPEESDETFIEKLTEIKASGLPVRACNSFLPGHLKSVGPDADHDKLLEYMETAFQRAEQAGVEVIVFGSCGSRSIPEGFSSEMALKQFIDLCSRMAPLAEKYNVVVALEPLNSAECNFINSVAEGGEIVRSIDHPNFRLLADIFHMLRDGEGPESILEYGDLLVHLHIAENDKRAAPGTNGENFIPYLQALKKVGYSGRMSIECRWEDLETQAGPALDYIRRQLALI